MSPAELHDHEGWILTSSGRRVWPAHLRLEDIHLPDLAHSLAHQCRWGGHARFFYSVAEHSVRVWEWICGVAPNNTDLRVWALLHDGWEAYGVDLPRPLKRTPELSAYRDLEARGLRVIAQRFLLSRVGESVFPEMIKKADNLQLKREARDLMPRPRPGHGAEEWAYLVEGEMPPGKIVTAMSPGTAKLKWLDAATREIRAHAESHGLDPEALL